MPFKNKFILYPSHHHNNLYDFPDVHIVVQKLSEESCHQLFKPSLTSGGGGGGSGGQDELLIPDTELRRMHAQGRKTRSDSHLSVNCG